VDLSVCFARALCTWLLLLQVNPKELKLVERIGEQQQPDA
jgi:hypothetical protein